MWVLIGLASTYFFVMISVISFVEYIARYSNKKMLKKHIIDYAMDNEKEGFFKTRPNPYSDEEIEKSKMFLGLLWPCCLLHIASMSILVPIAYGIYLMFSGIYRIPTYIAKTFYKLSSTSKKDAIIQKANFEIEEK